MKSMRTSSMMATMFAVLSGGLFAQSTLGSKLPFGGGHSYGHGKTRRAARRDKNSDLAEVREEKLRKAKRRMSNHSRNINQAYAKSSRF